MRAMDRMARHGRDATAGSEPPTASLGSGSESRAERVGSLRRPPGAPVEDVVEEGPNVRAQHRGEDAGAGHLLQFRLGGLRPGLRLIPQRSKLARERAPDPGNHSLDVVGWDGAGDAGKACLQERATLFGGE